MKPSRASHKNDCDSMRWLSLASAILVIGLVFQQTTALSLGSPSRVSSSFEPVAVDFAHSVTVQRYVTSIGDRRHPKPISRPSTAGKSWYRYALPLSTAVFLLSFSVWSLQSQPNHATRPWEGLLRGDILPAGAEIPEFNSTTDFGPAVPANAL